MVIFHSYVSLPEGTRNQDEEPTIKGDFTWFNQQKYDGLNGWSSKYMEHIYLAHNLTECGNIMIKKMISWIHNELRRDDSIGIWRAFYRPTTIHANLKLLSAGRSPPPWGGVLFHPHDLMVIICVLKYACFGQHFQCRFCHENLEWTDIMLTQDC